MTLKKFSSEVREWELSENEGIDPTDSFGVTLKLFIRENKIYLAEPGDLITPWITDKGRLFFDGLFKNKINQTTNWEIFLEKILELIYFLDHLNLQKKTCFFFIAVFDSISLETLNMLYILNQNCSFVKLRTIEKNKANLNFENNYQLSLLIEKPTLNMSTLGLLIGTNPRYEGYILNLNLRQRFLKGNFKLLTIGPVLDLTFQVLNLGSTITTLKSIGKGVHMTCQDIKNANFPILITNMEFYKRSDAKTLESILKYINVLSTVWGNLNILNSNLSFNGIYSMNKFLHISNDDLINFCGLYSLNASLNSISKFKNLTQLYLLKTLSTNTIKFQNSFLVNQSVHSLNNLFYDKVKTKMLNSYFYFPTNIIYEDNETYVNTQGMIKRVNKLLHFKKDIKTNWQLTRKLYSKINYITFFNNVKDNMLIQFDCINVFDFKNYFSFQYFNVQTLTSLNYYLIKQNFLIFKSCKRFFKDTKIKTLNTKIKYWFDDFFNTNGRDFFSYNSSVLVNCSKIIRSSSTNFFI